MYNIMYFILPINALRARLGFTEQGLAQKSGLSRLTIRRVQEKSKNVTIDSLARISKELGRQLYVLTVSDELRPEYSIVATSYKILRDGDKSWKIHIFNFVDEFRRTLDPALMILGPDNGLNLKLQALLASIVLDLCHEVKIDSPSWACKSRPLDEPWFVAETESLKASALIESAVFYKKNNIFVLENFLRRA